MASLALFYFLHNNRNNQSKNKHNTDQLHWEKGLFIQGKIEVQLSSPCFVWGQVRTFKIIVA